MATLRDQSIMKTSQVVNTNGKGAVETTETLRKTAIKKSQKIKDGTDGIDATDEKEFNDRLEEGFELMGDGD